MRSTSQLGPAEQNRRKKGSQRTLTLPNSTLLMTFSATSPGSGFHGEGMLRKVDVGPVFRSVEVGASRVWVEEVDGDDCKVEGNGNERTAD